MIVVLLAFTGAAAAAQGGDSAPGIWTRTDGRVVHAASRISLPDRAGAVDLLRMTEFSHTGQGTDAGLQYATPDQRMVATAYVYLPGLAHAGLTAFMTGEVMRLQSPDLRELSSGRVAAGDHQGAAIRRDYSGYRDGFASSAAFVKAGRWIVKLRVSGPEARSAEVRAAMDALLAGLRFEGSAVPRQAVSFEPGRCASRGERARALPDSHERMTTDGLFAATDGAGMLARDTQGRPTGEVPGRTAGNWCVSSRIRVGERGYAILRGGAASAGFAGRAVMLVPVNDAGTTLEQVEFEEGRFTLLWHEIGRTSVLGSYDAPLSDDQVADILSGADREGGRERVRVDILGDGNTRINVPAPPAGETTT